MTKKKEIYSPCISVCTIEDDTGFCRGCFRTLDEITHWKTLSEKTRTDTLSELDKRRALHSNAASHPYYR